MQRRYINESLIDLIDEGTYPECLQRFIDFDETWMMPIFKRAFKIKNATQASIFD